MDDPWKRPAFGSAVFYKDPKAASKWLERAFGFETTMVITDKGHMRTFGQTVRHVIREEAEKTSGLKIEGWV